MKRFLVALYFFFLTFFLLISSGVIDSQDGFQYLAVARNIYYTGKPTAPLYEYDVRKNIYLSTYVGKDGNTYSFTGLGYSLALVPAVALTDMFYKIYDVQPSIHFPLENDWLILLFASFTNSFFAALLGVTIFVYLLELGLNRKQSLLISIAGMLGTNLLVYAKNSFAHMMFTAFLFLAFFLVKKHFNTNKKKYLVFSGMAFGITGITYNQTFLLPVIPLLTYFILLSKFKPNLSSLKSLSSKLLFFFIGFLPFLLVYIWFENLKSLETVNLANPLTLADRGINPLMHLKAGVFIEGLFGQLFSPGRSIFLYSPILFLIIIFWHKIKKVIFPELIVFLSLFFIYVIFYGAQFSTGSAEQGITGLWHGESSWGPRYLLPLIPFGLLIVGFIYSRLKNRQKLFVFLPLLLGGFYIELLGVIMPYQIKYHELQDKFFVNSTEFTNFTYSNLIPRFSPVFMMSKNLLKLERSFPETLNHGTYNVRFYDGIDFSFPVGGEKWRVIDKKGFISFDNPGKSPVKKMSLGLINHPIEEASYSATVNFSVNDNLLKQEQFLPRERKTINLEIPEAILQPEENRLVIDVQFKFLTDGSNLSDTNSYKDNPALYTNKTIQPAKSVSQILSLISFSINDSVVNKESLDFPYVSSLGPAMTGKPYLTFGGLESDPWKVWDIHTQIYERVPDFWWFKFIYYWDVPKMPVFLLLASLLGLLIFSGFKTYKYISNK